MLERNLSLKPYNTFGIDVTCASFVKIRTTESLCKYLADNDFQNPEQYLVLGGGSNILFTDRISKTVLYNQIKGLEIERSSGKETIVSAGGGEVWHDFVLWCLKNNLGGIENLSLIPGSVGAAPIQNIGAYGVELKDVFYKLEAIHLRTSERHTFFAEECKFAYRSSIFKAEYKGEFLITKLYLKLNNAQHHINTSYGAIQQRLQDSGILNPNIKDVSNAVIWIRQSKLPDPKILGNSGSFFKNPIIGSDSLNKLKIKFPDIQSFPVGENQCKLAAGWLIEKAGWKGKRVGETGCYKDQALVIVNYGNATGVEVSEHAQRVIASVYEKFGVSLEPEVNIFP